MKRHLNILLAATLILMISLGCKKMSTPNEEAKAIFGSWNYENNTGGFTGDGESTRFNTDTWVKFTEKGYFKIYEGSKKKSQQKFKIEMKKSIYDTELRSAIVYNNGDYETFEIENNTLWISDEAFDGYSYKFTRK